MTITETMIAYMLIRHPEEGSSIERRSARRRRTPLVGVARDAAGRAPSWRPRRRAERLPAEPARRKRSCPAWPASGAPRGRHPRPTPRQGRRTPRRPSPLWLAAARPWPQPRSVAAATRKGLELENLLKYYACADAKQSNKNKKPNQRQLRSGRMTAAFKKSGRMTAACFYTYKR